jgi:hypothetical protein
MLVLGVTNCYKDDEEFAGDIMGFRPKSTWMGSANWTVTGAVAAGVCEL